MVGVIKCTCGASSSMNCVIYVYWNAESLILDGDAVGLWSKLDSYQGIGTATATVTVQSRPQKMF